MNYNNNNKYSRIIIMIVYAVNKVSDNVIDIYFVASPEIVL